MVVVVVVVVIVVVVGVVVVVIVVVVVVVVVVMPVPTGEAHCIATGEVDMPPRPYEAESDEALYAAQPSVLHELADLSQNGYV